VHHRPHSNTIYILPDIMNKHLISGNNTEQVLQSQITDLQDNVVVTRTNVVVTGTNFGVGPGTFTMLTTGTNNVTVGNGAAGGIYGIQTGNIARL